MGSAIGRPTKKVTAPHSKRSHRSSLTNRNVDLKEQRKFANIKINGSAATSQLDCASDIAIISKRIRTSIGKSDTRLTEVVAMRTSGDTINIVGEFNTEITIQEVTIAGRIFVTSNPNLNVLGIETIE